MLFLGGDSALALSSGASSAPPTTAVGGSDDAPDAATTTRDHTARLSCRDARAAAAVILRGGLAASARRFVARRFVAWRAVSDATRRAERLEA
ncbi:MAG: hypothetical protein AAFW59_10895, partial [Pseudomonadota bacterium]